MMVMMMMMLLLLLVLTVQDIRNGSRSGPVGLVECRLAPVGCVRARSPFVRHSSLAENSASDELVRARTS